MKVSQISRMSSSLLCSLLLLVSTISAQAAPVLTADPNPVVLPSNGATTTGDTTITWDAGDSQLKSARIYMSVDGSKEDVLVAAPKGTKSVPITIGKVYSFTLYSDSKKSRTLAFQTVTAKLESRRNPPPPATPTVPTGIGNVQVFPSDHNAIVTFDAPPNQIPIVEIGKTAPTRGPDGLMGIYQGGYGYFGGGNGNNGKALGHYKIDPSLINQLEPNTHYFYLINAIDGNGKRQQVPGQFTTRSQTVVITWDAVHVLNDSDPLGSGEITFWFWANYGQPGAQSFGTGELDLSTGNWHDLKRSVTIANAPDILNLSASGSDRDFNSDFKGEYSNTEPSPIERPEDTGNSEVNVANGVFDLSNYSGNDATTKFTLSSMDADGGDQGDLRFEVTGTIHVIRGTIGSTSSPLQTGPADMWQTTPIAPPGPNLFATFLYGLQPDGTLVWWRHDGADYGLDKWQGPRKVGTRWRFKKIIAGGGNVIYAVADDGKLLWLQHTGFNTGDGVSELYQIQPGAFDGNNNNGTMGGNNNGALGNPGSNGNEILGGGNNNGNGGRRPRFRPNQWAPAQSRGSFVPIQLPDGAPPQGQFPPRRPQISAFSQGWKGPVEVASGWDKYKQVFGGGDGVIYALTEDGTLLWFRHDNFLSGTGGQLEGPKVVAHGVNLKHLFSNGSGIIYGVGEGGALMRAKHLGIADGSENWLMYGDSIWQQIDTGWDKYNQIFSPGINNASVPAQQKGPIIYAIDKQGQVWWRDHLRPDANGLGRNWFGPKDTGRTLKGYRQVIALIPANLPEGGGVH